MDYNPDEENNEYSDEEYQQLEDNYDEDDNSNDYDNNDEDFNESLEDVINSYNPDEISLDSLEGIANDLRTRVNDLKNIQLPTFSIRNNKLI